MTDTTSSLLLKVAQTFCRNDYGAALEEVGEFLCDKLLRRAEDAIAACHAEEMAEALRRIACSRAAVLRTPSAPDAR